MDIEGIEEIEDYRVIVEEAGQLDQKALQVPQVSLVMKVIQDQEGGEGVMGQLDLEAILGQLAVLAIKE